MNLRDPKHRMELTFPGKPVTRRVSPSDIEAYLKARGYLRYLSVERDWPDDIAYCWALPGWPDPHAPPIHIRPVRVRGPRLCSNPLDQIIEAIAHNEGRTPGEVLREIAVHAQLEDGV